MSRMGGGVGRRAWRDVPGPCHYCGRENASTWDHVVPHVLGGPKAQWNAVRSCEECNVQKDWRPKDDHCEDCIYTWAKFYSKRADELYRQLLEKQRKEAS